MKLIKMTDFILKEYNCIFDTPYNDGALTSYDAQNWVKYAKFLKQPLKLEMFVPCFNGVALENPKRKYGDVHANRAIKFNGRETTFAYYTTLYKQAKEKVLFEGFFWFENHNGSGVTNNLTGDVYSSENGWLYLTIEDLTINESKIELTETGKKQIGL